MSTYDHDRLVQAFRKARRGHYLDDDGQSGIDSVAFALADLLGEDNPAFDDEAFLRATGTVRE